MTKAQITLGPDEDTDVGLATKTKPKTERPKMFKVLLLNDDSHSFPEVINTLVAASNGKFTSKQATDLAEYVDKEGRDIIIVGTYRVNYKSKIFFLFPSNNNWI